jgi:hypothetical protein
MNTKSLVGTAVAIALVGLASLSVSPREIHAGPGAHEVVVTNGSNQAVPVEAIETREPLYKVLWAVSPEVEAFQVPADRRAVIESVSCYFSSTYLTSRATWTVRATSDPTKTDSTSESEYYLLSKEGDADPGGSHFRLTQAIQLHASPGSHIMVGRSPGGAGTWSQCYLAGYLTAP